MPPLNARQKIIFFLITLCLPFLVNAAEAPKREQRVIQTYMAYEWHLLAWADSQLSCVVQIDHPGLPKASEIASICAPEVIQRWQDYPICDAATNGGDLASCPGLYLHFIRSLPAEREVVVQLPPASASVSLTGCEVAGGEGGCANFPFLKIDAFEPLPDQRIVRVHFHLEAPQRTVLWRGHQVRVALLETYHGIEQRRGRQDRVAAIAKVLPNFQSK